MTGFFITGTDTDVGKTFIAARIARSLIQQGFSVRVRKPIASGCTRQADGSLLSDDALRLQQGANSNENLQEICPYQFEPAISPHLALQQAGKWVTIEQLAQSCHPTLGTREALLVEGAGGWLSPLANDGFNRDLAVQLRLPVILVIANRLGCINHALLTAQAIQQSGLTLHCAVVNQVHDKQDFSSGLEDWIECPIYRQEHTTDSEIIPLADFKL
ncbi:ATP-dependent dethiobiotin synthetase BioD [Thiosulfatimonas sediminis]|uniref:ATP-dependent dethiobiotin synthetase BioD n=1 Tax=Thiosulfatimonas sediminis TaxID=2675054 RepID=A0A6F8PSH6_9GAMM|nr:dethiobiotin synthase [Thiosulfatimonas sediminis]BBP44940.1 ATP-dependent dethiobiotin synthetase BioD [Thiosulfatimonas sediminis]